MILTGLHSLTSLLLAHDARTEGHGGGGGGGGGGGRGCAETSDACARSSAGLYRTFFAEFWLQDSLMTQGC